MIDAPIERERLLSTREVARRFAVSTTTIRRLVAAGEIEGIRIGSQVRIEPVAIEEYVDRRRRR
jgi:excisionase family DNA binding protein